jgi:DNA-binding cell septation regulator SpoVG
VYLQALDHNASSKWSQQNVRIKSPLHVSSISQTIDTEVEDKGDDSSDCIRMAEWQSKSFPTCNLFHEANIFSSSQVLTYFSLGRQRSRNRHFNSFIHQINSKDTTTELEHAILNSYRTKLLGNGWFRDAWKVTNFDQSVNVAVKTLRYAC